MPGMKGRSGGGGKKSVVRHIAEGTYRKDRHGEVISTQDREEEGELVLLSMLPEEASALDIVTSVLGKVQPRMSLPLSLLAHNLALYIKLHADVVGVGGEFGSGVYDTDRFGREVLSPRFKAQDQILKQLRADFTMFAMSYSEQASILEIANRASKTMSKPNPGKPM